MELSTRVSFRSLGRGWSTLLLWLCWAAALTAGYCAMVRYERTPGPDTATPMDWPVQSRVSHATDRPTLVLFLHPRCPCSAATLTELERLLAQYPDAASLQLLYFAPAGADAAWTAAPLLTRAARLPGVTLRADEEGREAALFHAATSGQALLYSAEGRLLFHGGLTGARGHAGENAGVAALRTQLGRPDRAPSASPVYGCSLQSSFTPVCLACPSTP